MEETKPKTGKYALTYGLILGAISVVFIFMLYSLDMHYQGGPMVMGISLIITIAMIVIGMMQFKKDNNGFMSFGEGLKIGVGIGLIAVGSSIAGRLDIAAFGLDNALSIVLLTLVFAVIGWSSGRVTGLKRADCSAIEMETVVRNVNLGILIKATLFPAAAAHTAALGDTVLFALLLYGAVQLLLAAGLIAMGRRSSAAGITQ